MRVYQLMTQPATTCHVNDTLAVAAGLMWEHDCGAIAVVRDDQTLVGMITDRDICMATYTQGRAPEEILVTGIMASPAVVAYPDEKPDEVERLMADHQLRRLPVVDADDRPIGLISLTDLARESAQPDGRVKHGRVGHILALITQPRSNRRTAT